ncbi:MAG: tRNA (adenine-N1)-methyltransferase, partial [Anaerolineales bacterium]|nr:tRNA (adenine-N1)-methyltransferase [Anaerolineales bacterium]
MALAQAGAVVQLVGRDNRYFIVRLAPGQRLETHRGVFAHDDLIGQPLGSQVFTHLGHAFFLIEPSTDDLIRDIKRNSQIIYPKDSGFILMKLSVQSGQTVLEAGTGSGAMTTVLAQAVGPAGRVVSYDIRSDMQRTAQRNLERVGLAARVTLKLRDIAEGFDEVDAAAFFLDVPNPWDYTGQVRQALKGGGFFGSIVPTANQVSTLLVALQRDSFEFVEVCEVLLRYYKAVPERLRPADRMVAHTGYLVFARPVTRRPRPADAPPEHEGDEPTPGPGPSE